jgi:3-oxoacyl-[acyl-carrier-protein] synthase-1
MGIVSSIGNNTQEVLSSLHEARSGITRAEKYAEMGFRSQVQGAPTLNPAGVIDRRAMRFLAEGAAWNHVAMEQAIQDAGLELSDVSNARTGIIMGSGGPSARTIVESADITRSKGPKRVGPFAVPKAMSSTASATLATWFKIKGVNYSISSASPTRPSRSASRTLFLPAAARSWTGASRCCSTRWARCPRNTTTRPQPPRGPTTSIATAL